MSEPTKLYALMQKSKAWNGDYLCALIAPTGDVLYEHISSSLGWGRRDLEGGLKRNHNVAERFPAGYELVDLLSWADAPAELREANEKWAAS